jgi:hypothetical protein
MRTLLFQLAFFFSITASSQPYQSLYYATLMVDVPNYGMTRGQGYFGVVDSVNFTLVQTDTLPLIDDPSSPLYNVKNRFCLLDPNGDITLIYNNQAVFDRHHNIILDSIDIIDGEFVVNQNFSLGLAIFETDSIMYLPICLLDAENIMYSNSLITEQVWYNLSNLHAFNYSLYKFSFGGDSVKLIDTTPLLKVDTANYDFMLNARSIVRHGNGRDWWFICRDKYRDRYYVELLTPWGIDTSQSQRYIFDDESLLDLAAASCEIISNADGDRLAVIDFLLGLRMYDFDRCSGRISNRQKIGLLNQLTYELLSSDSSTLYNFGGERNYGAFSPSSEYFYYTRNDSLFQVNLSLPLEQVLPQKQLISINEFGAFEPNPQNPNQTNHHFSSFSGKAGNGRIVIKNIGPYYGSLTNLDSPADSIIYEHQCYFIPFAASPTGDANQDNTNYSLFDWSGSACDTLGIDGPIIVPPVSTYEPYNPKLKDIQIWPNPVSSTLNLRGNSGQGDIQIRVSNAMGQVVEQLFWPNGIIRHEIDMTYLPPQMCLVTFTDEKGSSLSHWVAVVR